MKPRLWAWALAFALQLPGSAAFGQDRDPHAGVAGIPEATPDKSEPAADLPAGTIEAQIVDDKDQPVPHVEVRLAVMFQSIAEGESKSQRLGRADANGKVKFSGLERGGNFSYRVTIKSGAAEYASPPLQLREAAGHRVLLHSYPVTRDVQASMVGMRGFIYVEPRDDVFQFEVLFRVFNVGRTTWVPSNTSMRLPEGYKAFKANESMSDTRFEADGAEGARLLGTFSPGQHDISFRFQMPKPTESAASFSLGLPPHVAEIRVIAEASPNMKLDVDGFEPPQTTVNQTGERVLVTRRVMQRGAELKGFTVLLTGLPVPGPGRWIAVLIAAGLALTGVGTARGWFVARVKGARKIALQDVTQAREILLSELVLLQKARESEQIGPGAYDQARRILIDSLARIGAQEPTTAAPKKRKPKGVRRKVA